MQLNLRNGNMAYNSYSYLILFLGLTLILYYLFPKKAKWVVLLAASYVFYIISCGKYIVFPIMTTITVYVCGIWLEKINASFELKKKDADKETRKALKKKAHIIQAKRRGFKCLSEKKL